MRRRCVKSPSSSEGRSVHVHQAIERDGIIVHRAMFCDQQLAPRGVISSLHLFFCSYAHVALRRVCLRDTKGRYAPECWGLLCQPGFAPGGQPALDCIECRKETFSGLCFAFEFAPVLLCFFIVACRNQAQRYVRHASPVEFQLHAWSAPILRWHNACSENSGTAIS